MQVEAARALYATGDIEAARAAAQALLDSRPGGSVAAGAHVILVECARRRGDRNAALAHARAAVEAAPGDPRALYALGVCLDEQGDADGAVDALRRSIAIDDGSAQSHRTLGVILLERGAVAEATASLERATMLDPANADGWNSLGTALHHANRLNEAEAAYRTALRLRPDFPRAECNVAVLQRDQGDAEQAEATLRACIGRRPPENAYRPAFTALADLVRARGDLDEAARLYLASAKLAPADSSGDMLDLGLVLTERGDSVQAKKAFMHALERNPRSLRAAFASRLELPMVYADAADVARHRSGFADGLSVLEGELDGRLASLHGRRIVDGLIWSNFFIAYQGEDDRALQSRYARLAARVVERAEASWHASIPAPAVSGRRVRVGFLSALLREGTVGHYFTRWLTDLDRDRFELFFYPLASNVDTVTQAILARADRVHPFIGGDALPSMVVPVIREEALDILVFPELGMDHVTFALAAMRMAPRQCAAWGHPVTTGHGTIDHFLSCDVMEPPDAQQHYVEQLTRLPGIGSRFARPDLPPPAERAMFGLPEQAALLLCPQSLFKIHPDNDAVLTRVLAANPNAVLVLFEGRHPAITDQFMRRLQRSFEAAGISIRERTRVLPQMSHAGYLAINQACDAMLDTLRWSGGQTSVDALDCGLPVVTLPGAMMRGRQSAGMLRLIGVEELIAADVDDYVRIANRLCADAAWRAELSARIRANVGRLFDDPAPIAALENFLSEIAARPVG